MKAESRPCRFAVQVLKRFFTAILILSLIPYLIPLPGGGEAAAPFPESAFAEVNGVTLHYRFWKPREIQGKVLLVHGLGGSTFSWRHNVEALVGAGYLVAAVDLPGFGYSSRRKGLDHSQEARAEALWDLAGHLDGELPGETAALGWNLVGHSMGGGTIAAMALQAPFRVGSLTLVAGAVSGRPPGPLAAILSFPPAARWLQVAARYYLLTPPRIRSFLTSAYGEEPPEDAVAGYLEPLALPGTVDTLIDMTRTGRSLVLDDLAVIASPALLLWGDEDAWVPLEAGEKLARALPAAELIIFPGAGHCPMETRPQEFNQALLNFLQKHGAP